MHRKNGSNNFLLNAIYKLPFKSIFKYISRLIVLNITKITSFPKPNNNKKQLKSFLGTADYYRCLIPHFAQITHPVVYLTSPKESFKWTNAHDEAFTKLQKYFSQNLLFNNHSLTKLSTWILMLLNLQFWLFLCKSMMDIYFKFLILIRPCGLLKPSTRLLN